MGAGALRFTGTAPAPPSASIMQSWTIFTTCWAGETLSSTSWPTARVRTLAMKSRTTGSATSASSRARRTSRKASATSSSDSRPCRRSRSKTPESFPERDSNTPQIPRTRNAPVREHSRTGGEPGYGDAAHRRQHLCYGAR